MYFRPEDDGEERERHAGPLTQIDLRLSKHFTEHLEIAAGVDNLLDEVDPYALLRPRTVYASVGGKY